MRNESITALSVDVIKTCEMSVDVLNAKHSNIQEDLHQIQLSTMQLSNEFAKHDHDGRYVKSLSVQSKVDTGIHIADIIADGIVYELSAPSSSGPVLQEQADWNEKDSSKPAFIKNKPNLSQYALSSDVKTLSSDVKSVTSLLDGMEITILSGEDEDGNIHTYKLLMQEI